MKTVFIVLHYKAYDVTVRCIDSILKYQEVEVMVMDNGSCDGSGERLKRHYSECSNVQILISQENLGFSRGNDAALAQVRKQKIPCSFVIVCNNDLVFEQSDFLEQLKSAYQKDPVAVIGPDIQVAGKRQVHQNPLALRAKTRKEIKNYIAFNESELKELNKTMIKNRIKEILHLPKGEGNHFVRNSIDGFDYRQIAQNVCLCGACLIFTPLYFQTYQKLFWPATYFYHEEEILYHKLKNKSMGMQYLPQLTVLHDHSVSTHTRFKGEKQKRTFEYKNGIKSSRILLRYLDELEKQKVKRTAP